MLIAKALPSTSLHAKGAVKILTTRHLGVQSYGLKRQEPTVTPRETSIAIVGGGIGGLAAALSLSRAGFDVQVYEQAREAREVGAGIQISPNATRILHRLGLAEQMAAMGVEPLALRQRRWDDGRTLAFAPLGETVEIACGSPYYQCHRADLLNALLSCFPAERLHVGHRLTDLIDHGNRVEVHFGNGNSIAVDALVGADGIHSSVRRILFGTEDPRFTGCVAYRGLVAADRLAHLNLPVEFEVWMGPGKHFVHYFVRNGGLVNFVAIIEQDSWTHESWTEQAEVADVLAAFDGWHPQVRSILVGVEEAFIWGLFDHPPMEHWSVGRVTLLGDACHAMLPFTAQGDPILARHHDIGLECVRRADQAAHDETDRRTFVNRGGHSGAGCAFYACGQPLARPRLR